MNWCILFLGGIPHLCTLKMMIFSLRWQVAQWDKKISEEAIIRLYFIISKEKFIMNYSWIHSFIFSTPVKLSHEEDIYTKWNVTLFIWPLKKALNVRKSQKHVFLILILQKKRKKNISALAFKKVYIKSDTLLHCVNPYLDTQNWRQIRWYKSGTT